MDYDNDLLTLRLRANKPLRSEANAKDAIDRIHDPLTREEVVDLIDKYQRLRCARDRAAAGVSLTDEERAL